MTTAGGQGNKRDEPGAGGLPEVAAESGGEADRGSRGVGGGQGGEEEAAGQDGLHEERDWYVCRAYLISTYSNSAVMSNRHIHFLISGGATLFAALSFN